MSDARTVGVARVCVTGGLGFIGRHLCRRLVDRGYDVVCLDRVVPGSGRRGWDAPPGVELVAADVSVDPLEPLLDGADAVMHLAALAGVRASHPLEELWRHNAIATARLVRALDGSRRLVLASTSSVYGDAARLPTPETWPPAPLNAYALTKLAAERAVLRAAGGGSDTLACRLFTVFGPGQRPDMAFARWIRAIAGAAPVPWCARAGARREFTYVADAVDGLVAALERGRAGEVYNLAGSGSSPVRTALAEIERVLGRRARLRPQPGFSEALATAACGAKARAELGYAPRVGLREGLERQIAATVPSPVPSRVAA